MLIDNVTIKVTAGKGGDGKAAFNKIKMALGPTGGSGGKGGDIYLEAVADLGALRRFRVKKSFKAENGLNGRDSFRDGHDGKDLVLLVPRGTIARNLGTDEQIELTTVGERVLAAHGGKGGKGNFHFRSPTNTSPKEFQRGLEGEQCSLELELKLIADIGLVGFPNIGKSSFLNEITNAQSKVANYSFTTLEPHLGSYYGLIIADIPGLIEGASSGKGLGIKFLRHIERTRVLFHFIDADSKDPLADYQTIRRELGAHNKLLLNKPEYIIVSRTDTASEERVSEIIKTLTPLNKELIPISIHDHSQMAAMKELLNRLIEKLGISKKL